LEALQNHAPPPQPHSRNRRLPQQNRPLADIPGALAARLCIARFTEDLGRRGAAPDAAAENGLEQINATTWRAISKPPHRPLSGYWQIQLTTIQRMLPLCYVPARPRVYLPGSVRRTDLLVVELTGELE
jgi:hypothetical protein